MVKNVNKFCGIVVLYKPSSEVLDNIKTYISYLDKLFVVDNSENPNFDIVNSLLKNPKVDYLCFGENKGIAYALNIGASKAIKCNYEFCLTMDQDSSFNDSTRVNFIKEFQKINNFNDIGIIGLNFEKSKLRDGNYVKTWITSGNFLNLNVYKLTAGFNNGLFIDYVDFDYNEKLNELNKKVYICKNAIINHKIGNPIELKFFFKKYYSMNHSPIRYYYRYRNSLYLYKRNRKFYWKIYFKELYIQTLKMLIFEKERGLKISYIAKGRRDAKKSILGEYYGK